MYTYVNGSQFSHFLCMHTHMAQPAEHQMKYKQAQYNAVIYDIYQIDTFKCAINLNALYIIYTRRNIHVTQGACTSGFTRTYTRLLGQYRVEVHTSTSRSNRFNSLTHTLRIFQHLLLRFSTVRFNCLCFYGLTLLTSNYTHIGYLLDMCMLYTASTAVGKLHIILHRPQT